MSILPIFRMFGLARLEPSIIEESFFSYLNVFLYKQYSNNHLLVQQILQLK